MGNEDSRGRWAKKDKENNKDLVLKKIEEKDRKYSELKKLNFSDPTLSTYLKELITKELIEWYEDPEDRRVKWYRIKQKNIEQVRAKLLKYDAIKFIESIENPRYIFKTSKKSKATGSVFVTRLSPYEWEGGLKHFEDFAWNKILENLLKSWLKLADKLISPKTPLGGKIAIVLTNES